MNFYTVISVKGSVLFRNNAGGLITLKAGDKIPENALLMSGDAANLTIENSQSAIFSLNVSANSQLSVLLQSQIQPQSTPDSQEQEDETTIKQDTIDKLKSDTGKQKQSNVENEVIDSGHFHAAAETVERDGLEINVQSISSTNASTDEDSDTDLLISTSSTADTSTAAPITITGVFEGATIEDQTLNATGLLSLHGGAGAIPTQSYQGQYGTLTLSANGQWIYQLDNAGAKDQALSQGKKIEEHFTIHAHNTGGQDFTHALTIDITGTNDLPTLSVVQTTNTRGTLTEADVDTSDTHTFSVAHGVGAYGVLTVAPLTGDYSYSQNPSVAGMSFKNGVYSGQDIFEVKVSDNHGGEVSKFITFDASATVTAPATLGGQPTITTSPSIQSTISNQPSNAITHNPPTNSVTIDLLSGSDSGVSNTDNLTNDKNPTIIGHTDVSGHSRKLLTLPI